jgi:putative ABC transport system permease protein
MTPARRLYGAALRAFPRRHRDAYAAEMRDSFDRELQRRGGAAAFTFAIAASANAVASGLAERWRQRRWRLGPMFSALDFTLAWRMLVRYPGLSIVSVLGIAVGIAIAAGAFAVASTMSATTIPLEDGDEVVSVVMWDTSTSNNESRMVYDFAAWRRLTSVEDLSVTRTVQRNLIISGRPTEIVDIAEISAAAFRVARVPAFRGRHLLPEDEAGNAPNVVVIGYDEWVRRFDGDANVVGRSIQLGAEAYTIVGVMPDGFVFPLDHGYWIPWRIEPSTYGPRTGPYVNVFGRLRDGATIDSAEAEIAAFGAQAAAATPATHQHLLPRVVPYPYAYNDMYDPENVLMLQAIQLAVVLMLVVVCVNVASLVYARTATRQGEIAVRNALGAGRNRLVAQLFVEALLLASVAAAAGIGLAAVSLEMLSAALLQINGGNGLPFWMSLKLPPAGVFYIVALTVLAAAIIGVVPGLKATSRHVQAGLQTLSPGGGARMQMGRLWTMLIVAQVTLTTALLPMAIFLTWTLAGTRAEPGFASGEFLTAQLTLDRTTEAPTEDGERQFTQRLATLHGEIDRLLRRDSRVNEVTFSLTGIGDERAAVLEIEGHDAPIDPVDYNIVEGSKRGHLVRLNRVSINFFEALEVPVTMGRTFMPSDASRADTIAGVLVNRSLVDKVFGGANPLGARIRYVGRSREANTRDVPLNRWFEIVGVVPDFPNHETLEDERDGRIYHAAAFGDVYPATVSVRVRGRDPMAFAATFREISTAVDPTLQLRNIATAQMVIERERGMMQLIGATITIVMGSVIALAAAGMYALMSFTVARRRREIGIRAALGANRNRLLAGIFARVFAQLGAGAGLGLLMAVGLERVMEGQMFPGPGAFIFPTVVVVMMVIGALAALGPARKGLSIQPIEALREE